MGLAIAALHGELRRDPWRTRLAQLVFMAWLALLANWVRVYTVIERGYQTDMQTYLVRVSHYWFGWGVFAVALVIFFVVTDRLGPAPGPDPRPTRGCRRHACRARRARRGRRCPGGATGIECGTSLAQCPRAA